MYQIIVDFNEAEIADAHAHGECALPTVFKARDNGGYEPFAGYAVATGRGADWVAWSADEACPQADVLEDVEVSAPWASFCDVASDVMGWDDPTCSPSTEICGNGLDEDCDDLVDEGCDSTGTDPGTTGGSSGGSTDDGSSGTDCSIGCGGQRADLGGFAVLFGLGGLGVFRRRL